jgi:hypothetical protein
LPSSPMTRQARKKSPTRSLPERDRIFRWFQKNNPQDLDLYGSGWDFLSFGAGPLGTGPNRFTGLRKFLRPKHTVYKGTVPSKLEVLKGYRFSLPVLH